MHVHCAGIRARFHGLYELLGLQSDPHADRHGQDLGFNNTVSFMAAALDPKFGFRWLQDHPGSEEDKEELKLKITSIHRS